MRRLSLVGVFAGLTALATPAPAQDKKPEVRAKLEGHRGGVTAVAFSRDGKLIATGAGNGIVFLWDAKTGEQLARLNNAGGNTITAVALSPDGTVLAASARGLVPVWDVTDPKAPKFTGDHANVSTSRYTGVGVTGDGAALATARAWADTSYPGRAEFFGLKNGTIPPSGSPERFDVAALACAPDPDTQATAVYGTFGKDTPAVFLFGLGDTKTVTRGVPPFAKEGPRQIHYSPDGKWLGVCSGQFVVWKVPGSQIVGGEPLAVPGEAYAAAIGPRDAAVTVSGPVENQTAELTFWKLGTEAKKIATHKTDLADVRCVAFSPDGNTLAVGGYTDGVVQLWALGEEKK